MRTKTFGILLLAFFLTSCAVGPDYVPPEVDSPGTFSDASSSLFQKQKRDVDWWKYFEDPRLQQLILAAVKDNKDLKQALSRVNQSRFLAREARSGLFPGVQLRGSYLESRSSGSGFPGSTNEGFKFEQYSFGADASWEIDLFGGVRRELESANALYDTRVATLHDGVLSLVSEVAQNYFVLRGSQEQLRIARENLVIQKETLDIVEAKYEVGNVSELDKVRSLALLQGTKARIPLLEAQVKSAIYRLSVLLGLNPESLKNDLMEPKDIPVFEGTVQIDSPEEVLRKRPDIRMAERELASFTAKVGVAVAELFPKITLDGGIGVEASKFSELSMGAGTYSWGPKIIWRPLDNGTLRSRIKAADERASEALLAYENTVLKAFEDVENSTASYVAEKSRTEYLLSALKASQRAHALSREQYQEGMLDLQSVLDSQRVMLENESMYAESKMNSAIAIVSIYKALGGGWQAWEILPESS